jgi:predicted RNase H-like HicB family nuclease
MLLRGRRQAQRRRQTGVRRAVLMALPAGLQDRDTLLVTLPEWAERVLGPVTHEETYEAAMHQGKEALAALIASAQKHGEPLPAPHTYVPGQQAS